MFPENRQFLVAGSGSRHDKEARVSRMELPPGRYGRSGPRGRSRWKYWAALSVFLVAGVVVAVVGYRNLGSDPIDAEVTSFQVLDDHTVTITFTVDRDHPNQAADCIMRSRSKDGAEAGRGEVYVPPSTTTIQLTTRLRTVRTPTTGEVYGCSYQVPAYLTKSVRPSG